MKNISNEFKLIQAFFENEIKIRILTLGCISSGKSSLLNSIIGKDVLPVGLGGMTNIGIVINYTPSYDKICLKKAILKKTNNILEQYHYFEEELEIYSKLDNMKEIIELLNIGYLYEDEIFNLIINFIKNMDKIKIEISSKEILDLMKKVLLNKKENEFNKFIKYFEKVKKEDLNIINYKNIESKLREIIKKNPNILRKKINEDEKINENEKKK